MSIVENTNIPKNESQEAASKSDKQRTSQANVEEEADAGDDDNEDSDEGSSM